MKLRISVIIPTLNEASRLTSTLESVGSCSNVEVIVVDGGSADDTVETARSWGARVISTKPGRAIQMNAGAKEARGEILMFLHADTRLPAGWADHVIETLSLPNTVVGAFRLGFDRRRFALGLIAWVANLRSRVMGLPYGDQAIFTRRDMFEQIGGYRELPVMEDYEFIRRARKQGCVGIASSAVVTSARRWTQYGILRTTMLHQFMIVSWHLDVSPERIARWLKRAR